MAVYTCTLNPAIDLFIETPEMLPFTVNRTTDDDIQANGKGVNVSLILKMLGIENTALGFKAGFTGDFIEDHLRKQAVQTAFIDVPGLTRINVFTQVIASSEEYKLVNRGPVIAQSDIRRFLEKITSLEAGDYLCVSGSLPQGVPPAILIEISRLCHKKKIRLVIDTSYPEILACLPYQPFLLKPNEEELASWFGSSLNNEMMGIENAKKLIKGGAQNVLLSLGSAGAVFMNQEKAIWEGNSPRGKVVNTACAGDTLLGTFLAGIIKKEAPALNLQRSIAAGSSTAFQKGLTDFSDVEHLMEEITIKESGETTWQLIN